MPQIEPEIPDCFILLQPGTRPQAGDRYWSRLEQWEVLEKLYFADPWPYESYPYLIRHVSKFNNQVTIE